MRVLMISKACVVGIYQRKLSLMAQHPGITALKVLVPPAWRDERGIVPFERVHDRGYALQVTPIRFNGSFHFHYYPALGREAAAFRPDLMHIDEEPYNLATWLALRTAKSLGAKALFFSWQNLNRSYPLPVRLMEQWVLRNVDYAIMGTQSAADVWQQKGYDKGYAVIPQFGVDMQHFAPPRQAPTAGDGPLRIGYIGRLIHDKGVDVLLHALAPLQGFAWTLELIGAGPEAAALEQLSRELGLAERVRFVPWVPSLEMPARYQALDVLVLPSRTRPNWKEQFGRVLIEAMASEVVVVGSNSGAIPDVIGDAGLIFREEDSADLGAQLQRLLCEADLRQQLAAAGRKRVETLFTQEQVAAQTVEAYLKVARGTF